MHGLLQVNTIYHITHKMSAVLRKPMLRVGKNVHPLMKPWVNLQAHHPIPGLNLKCTIFIIQVHCPSSLCGARSIHFLKSPQSVLSISVAYALISIAVTRLDRIQANIYVAWQTHCQEQDVSMNVYI